MFDKINILGREELIKMGIEYKLLGYKNNFDEPFLTDNQIRLSLIKKLEKEENVSDDIQYAGGKTKNKKKKEKIPKK